ncbi:unnamed protein product [Thlaspi arvense]|uniref:Myb/SANT-like domain-containing protein n=1 Tax=Thlaspi arvense TaxID=13288 RepID=A0AAU9SDY4_THLAR|nr:unnamed protein product [Thlaspi arvense]
MKLFDEAIAMNNYTTKNHNSFGREYMVEKFNTAFNINITYGYFKNKLDEFKKNYKRWKALMSFIDISVDPEASMIYASDAWWKERELGCKITKAFNRKPPDFWDVMVQCFILHDVQSQSPHSAGQRRRKLVNEHEDDFHGSDTDRGDMLETLVPETQEEEDIYRLIVDDITPCVTKAPATIKANLQTNARRGSQTSRPSDGSGSRVGRRRQSFETTIQDTIAGYTDLQQLRLGAFDKNDYDEWKKAEAIFLDLEIPKSKFYWVCLNTLKELVFWQKYFIDIAGSSDEDKLQLLETITGVSQNNEDARDHHMEVHIYKDYHLANRPRWVTVQEDCGYQIVNNGGTPPNAQHWDSSQAAPQWGTPPTAQPWGTPPNAQQWCTPLNFQQCGTPLNAQQWGTPPNAPQWTTSPNNSQCRFSPNQTQNYQQGGSSGTTPTNVQYEFSVGSQEQSLRNSQQDISDSAAAGNSANAQGTLLHGLDFINYYEPARKSPTPTHGGLFNIWRSLIKTNININECHQSDSEDDIFSITAFCICQMRAQGLENLSYEERIQLWNLKNEQFTELVIQPTLTYNQRYFEKHKRFGMEKYIWHRLQDNDAAYLQILRMSLPCHCHVSQHCVIRFKQIMDYNQH